MQSRVTRPNSMESSGLWSRLLLVIALAKSSNWYLRLSSVQHRNLTLRERAYKIRRDAGHVAFRIRIRRIGLYPSVLGKSLEMWFQIEIEIKIIHFGLKSKSCFHDFKQQKSKSCDFVESPDHRGIKWLLHALIQSTGLDWGPHVVCVKPIRC